MGILWLFFSLMWWVCSSCVCSCWFMLKIFRFVRKNGCFFGRNRLKWSRFMIWLFRSIWVKFVLIVSCVRYFESRSMDAFSLLL